MAAKVPVAPGAHALAGDPRTMLPYRAAAGSGACDAIMDRSGLIDSIVYFGTESQNDINNGDTWQTPYDRVLSWATAGSGTAQMYAAYNTSTGRFTFTTNAGDQQHWIRLWHRAGGNATRSLGSQPKDPVAPSSEANAGHPNLMLPTRTTASSGRMEALRPAGRAGTRPFCFFFGPAASDNDIDTGDTWESPFAADADGSSGTALSVAAYWWTPATVTTTVRVSCDPTTGIFTFTASAADTAGWLTVDVAGG